jgi:hypothetical protein
MSRRFCCLIGWIACLAVAAEASAAVRYAKVSPTGTGNCTSWANACALGTTQTPAPGTALALAVAGDQIWVAAGTYPPIVLKEGVKIIGGFAGTETSALQSNPAANVTTITGGGVGRPVYSADHTAATVLRGFKIAHGYDHDDSGGGGLLLENSSAVIVQCIFEYNTAAYVGGAVMIRDGGSPQFINCIFRHNGATWPSDGPPYGGGAVLAYSADNLTFVNCLFYDNTAGEGGAFEIDELTLATFTNCTIADNHATVAHGGGIFDIDGRVHLDNSILWGNTTTRGVVSAEQIYSPWTPSTVVTYSDVQGGWAGTGNINADPLFLNAAGANYGISTSSPCKNVGNNAALPADVADLDWDGNVTEVLPKDLAALLRIRLTIVDMGAYEAFGSGGGGGQ